MKYTETKIKKNYQKCTKLILNKLIHFKNDMEQHAACRSDGTNKNFVQNFLKYNVFELCE